MLGLDLVPRIQCEPVNVNALSPVDLFLLHHKSSASTSASMVWRLSVLTAIFQVNRLCFVCVCSSFS